MENRLVFNNDKLKYITFSSKRKVNEKSYLIRSNRKSTAEETTVKLIGVNFDQNLHVVQSCKQYCQRIIPSTRDSENLQTLHTFQGMQILDRVLSATKTKLQ